MIKGFLNWIKSGVTTFVQVFLFIGFGCWKHIRTEFFKFLEGRVKASGEVRIVTWDGKTGVIKSEDVYPNLVVDVGTQHVADQMSDKSEASMSHMAIGTGTTAAAGTDTALETELSRKVLGSKTQGTGADANKVVYICEWGAGEGTGAITEAGMFNDGTAGKMFCRTVFPVKNQGSGDGLTMTWTLTIQRS